MWRSHSRREFGRKLVSERNKTYLPDKKKRQPRDHARKKEGKVEAKFSTPWSWRGGEKATGKGEGELEERKRVHIKKQNDGQRRL